MHPSKKRTAPPTSSLTPQALAFRGGRKLKTDLICTRITKANQQLLRCRVENSVRVGLDRAKALLPEANTPKAAKEVADIAKAAEVYSRRQKLSEETIQYAHEIHIDAKTMLGEFLAVADKNKGSAGTARGKTSGGINLAPPEDHTPTLKDMGISKKESSEAQLLSKVKAEDPASHEDIRAKRKTISEAKNELFGDRYEQGKSSLTVPPKHAPEDDESDVLWNLKRLWRNATKKDKSAFLKWAKK